MKILIVTSFDYPHVGGLSTHVSMIVDSFVKSGHEVDVVSFKDVNEFYGKYFIRGISFLLNKIKKGAGIVYTNKARMKVIRGLVEKKLKEKQYDVINAEDPAAMVALKGINKPKLLTVHGYALYEYLSIGSVLRDSSEAQFIFDLEKEAYNMADHIVSVDTRIRNYLIDNFKKDATIIRNFVDTEKFDIELYDRNEIRKELNISEDKIVLLCPRRLTEKNGVIYPAMAVNILKNKYKNIILFYAGDGEERTKIENYVKENNLGDFVKLLGGIPHEKVIKNFIASDIIIVPSVFSKGIEEATSIAAIEAMSLSKPTIASAIGGLKELIINNESGILVNEKDAEGLAKAIDDILSDEKLKLKIQMGGRERVISEFSLINGAEKYLNIYRSVIK